MYDAFSIEYDRFVNWPERLRGELPFILEQIGSQDKPRRILDAACGTGMHAIALARDGFSVVGSDLSVGMVEHARRNAAEAGIKAEFLTGGFGELAPALRREGLLEPPFDAVLCLGNSLPHLLTLDDLDAALLDFAACLRPGGRLFIQNRNFDAVMAQRQRWMEPQSCQEGDREWLFLRFYDFEPQGYLTFNILTLRREGDAGWEQAIHTTRLRPLLQAELIGATSRAGFETLVSYGNMVGAAFDPATSGNLILIGKKAH